MKHRCLSLILLCLLPLFVHAQQLVFGTIRDGFLKMPLPDARLTLFTTDSIVVQDSIKIDLHPGEPGRWGSADFRIELPKKTCTYLLRATLEGYEEAWQTFSVKAENDDIGNLKHPFELRRVRETKLDEVTVTATRLKMYYKGDTLIYDASAFKMPDGSMLDDLIRQLPGVTMNDAGEIFVNGRKVDELLLASRSFMNGNSKVLLENLPYYTVKDVKVYEKESDRNLAVGYEVEKKKYVMDVHLKDIYKNGHIGNVEAAGGTRERWLGRAFLLGFTDRLRFTLLANANNVNEKRHIGRSGSWTPASMPLSLLTSKSVAGEVDYESKNGRVKENLMVDFMASKEFGETVRRRELFTDGSTPLSTFRASNTSHANRLLAKNTVKLTVPDKIYVDLGVEFTYNKYNGNSESVSEDFLDELLATRLRSTRYNEGHAVRLNANGLLSPRIKNDILRPLSILYGFRHNDDKNETAQGFKTEQFVNPSTLAQYNANDFRHRETNGHFHLMWNRELGKHLRLDIQDRNEYGKKYDRDNLYHPDTLALPSRMDALLAVADPRNSYESDYREYYNRPTVMLRWKKYIPGEYMRMEYLSWDINLSTSVRSERLDYTRNNALQDKKRISTSLTPWFNFKIRPTKKGGEEVQLNLMYEKNVASIFDLLDYRDDATPQVVRLGNPNLKGLSLTTARINFTDRESRHYGQQYHLNGSFSYYHRQVAQSVVFNPENSQYTYQPKNVSGGYTANTHFDFMRSIDEGQRWTWQSNSDANFHHSVDYAMLAGETESRVNAVNTLTLREGAWIQYHKDDLNVRLTGDFRWRHSEGRMRDFSTLDAFDYQYGVTARYTIPVVKLSISLDAGMYSRRGYGSSAFDTDNFVVNAQLGRSFLKSKLIARIEAFDLFHQLSSTQYEVNAQGRTETWQRTLPNYVMLHVVYHFNKDPKQKK